MKFHPPKEIWIEQSVADTPLARRVRSRAAAARIEIIPDGEKTHQRFASEPSAIARGKRVLVLARLKGPFLKPCPCSPGVVSCGYDILNSANNCSLGCTYCILQHLMTNPALVLYANIEDLEAQLDAEWRARPRRRIRVGTGEFADSLELEPLTGCGAELVRAFARWPNAALELKTKTDFVDSLIGLDPGAAVIAWSLNPPRIIREEERRAAGLEERLAAARRAAQAGYRVGFHFDPMIHFPNWREEYAKVVDRVVEAVDPARIAWVSLGALRFPAKMKATMRWRFPSTPILDGEFVVGWDGKMRYFQPIRVEMFSFLAERLRQAAPGTAVYLCMETEDVWRRVFGRVPTTQEILDQTLTPASAARG